ncbi:hypothetical protein BDC45DRAFT_496095 [Circinella umbellata]|nr:hypothetical protein BDC45DRAFT_496095 [Circinella umbellata]
MTFEDSDGELEALAVPTWTNSSRVAQSTNGSSTSGRRRSKDLSKKLHQVQADLLVK